MAESNLNKLIQELSSDEIDQSIEIVKQLQKVLVNADGSESVGEFSEIHPDVKQEKESDIVINDPARSLSQELRCDEIDLSIATIEPLQKPFGFSDQTGRQGEPSESNHDIQEEKKYHSTSLKYLEEQKCPSQDRSGKYNDTKLRCKEEKHLDQLSSTVISKADLHLPDFLSSDIENSPNTILCTNKTIDGIVSTSIKQHNTDNILNLSRVKASLNNSKVSKDISKSTHVEGTICCKTDKSPKCGSLRIRPSNRSFHCKTCGANFAESFTLKQHVRIHTGERPFECKRCGAKFTQSGSLKKHMRVHTGERPFECKRCGAKFTESGSLKKHMRVHTGERPFECERCDAKFVESGNLKKHMRVHTGERLFECKRCDAKFTRTGNLKQHMRTHTGEKPFECKSCGSKFTQSRYLKLHVRIHTGEKPFVCKICGGKYNQSGNLKKHMRVHTGIRPFECTICGAKFTESGSLKKHMRVHTGERPFECERCDAKFIESGNLKKHMRVHTGKKTF